MSYCSNATGLLLFVGWNRLWDPILAIRWWRASWSICWTTTPLQVKSLWPWSEPNYGNCVVLQDSSNGVQDSPPLLSIYCNVCGRFLGKGSISVGEFYLKCPRCKSWTAVLDETLQRRLTMADMMARIGDRKAT